MDQRVSTSLPFGETKSYIIAMSRAFTREDDFIEDMPDRPISSHPNLVTTNGLVQIDAEHQKAQRAYGEAQASGDRHALARAARDLRYWDARRASARLVAPDETSEVVQFGSTVSIERSDGRSQRYRIVGEDEADPSRGTISYVSPLARALLGKVTGDVVRAGAVNAKIVSIGAKSADII
jgi:transcription elongation GreA/GreB family factor